MLWRTNVWEAGNVDSEDSQGRVGNTFPFKMQIPLDSAI